jgi:biopolymer transport protein ExbD
MAKQASKIQEKGMMGRLNMRMKERAEEGRKREARLMLVSLIDTFVILVVFLFQNFSAEGDIMSIAPDLTLPEARIDNKPTQSVIVAVTNESIVVEGKRVADSEEALMDPDLVIDGLYEEMVRIADLKRAIAELDDTKEFRGEVIIQGDKQITFELLKRVMYTCGRAEYGEISLAVLKNG